MGSTISTRSSSPSNPTIKPVSIIRRQPTSRDDEQKTFPSQPSSPSPTAPSLFSFLKIFAFKNKTNLRSVNPSKNTETATITTSPSSPSSTVPPPLSARGMPYFPQAISFSLPPARRSSGSSWKPREYLPLEDGMLNPIDSTPRESSPDSSSSVNPEVTPATNEGPSVYCSTCNYHFNLTLQTSCCNTPICHQCVISYLRAVSKPKNTYFETTSSSNSTMPYSPPPIFSTSSLVRLLSTQTSYSPTPTTATSTSTLIPPLFPPHPPLLTPPQPRHPRRPPRPPPPPGPPSGSSQSTPVPVASPPASLVSTALAAPVASTDKVLAVVAPAPAPPGPVPSTL